MYAVRPLYCNDRIANPTARVVQLEKQKSIIQKRHFAHPVLHLRRHLTQYSFFSIYSMCGTSLLGSRAWLTWCNREGQGGKIDHTGMDTLPRQTQGRVGKSQGCLPYTMPRPDQNIGMQRQELNPRD